jgi:hypothetical protein
MAYLKRRRRGSYSKSRKRVRRNGSFRPGTGRRLRSTRFSRRSYAPGLMPESKYADAAYGNGYQNVNVISPGIGSGTLLLDANGAATVAASQNAGDPTPVAGIINGAGFNQRIGRKILLKYLSVRMHIRWLQVQGGITASTVGLVARVRIMLFYDRQPNLSLPAAADVMNINPGLDVETFQEDRNRDRFVRLMDQTVPLSLSSASGANENSSVTLNKVVKIGGIQVYNDAGTGTVTSIQTGSIFWMFMWDLPGTGVLATTPPAIDLVSRLRFADL